MKTVGIIGGIGPESTVAYYRLLVDLYRERKPDGSYPSVIINSIDMQKMLGLIGADELSAVTEYLAGEVKRLARAGADFGLLAANMPHVVFDGVSRQSPIPLLSIVEATCAAAKVLGSRKLGLFGTRFTMQGRFYADVFSAAGIELVVPNEGEQAFIHAKYMNELIKGKFLADTREQMLEIADRLKERTGLEGLILGGTELSLILRYDTYRGIPLLDTTQIHVQAAVTELFS